MTFKKSLRTKSTCQGQSILEYFIVFAAIALVTILSLTTFGADMRRNTENFFRTAVGTRGLNVENN